jgi:type II secretory pathway component PulF
MDKKKKQKNKLIRILEYDVSIGKNKQIMFENLVLMITSGIGILSALEEFSRENNIKSLKEVLEDMVEEIKGGQPFWKTLSKHKIIKENLIDIIRIGEESGNLKQNLSIVLTQQRKDKEVKAKLQTASLYPAIILIVMLVVGVVVAVFVLPRLTEVYSSFKTELPFLTQQMINLGKFMGSSGQIVVPLAVLILIIILYFIFIFRKTKWLGQKILFVMPVIKTALMQLEMSRLGHLMDSLLKSGFKVVDALDIIRRSTDLRDYERFYLFLADSIANGDSFAQSFNKYPRSRKLLPLYARQAIIAGERTGQLESSFSQVGTTFQKEYENTTANMYVLMEPILLILVWIGVFIMALAVITPIYSLMGNFSSQSGVDAQVEDNVVKKVYPKLKVISDGIQNIPIYSSVRGSLIIYAIPDEVFEYSDVTETWYAIRLKDGSVGWVEQKYVQLLPDITDTSVL